MKSKSKPDVTSPSEKASPPQNRKYRFCYFCADYLTEDGDRVLECSHQFCSKCVSNLLMTRPTPTYDRSRATDASYNNYLQLVKLFRAAKATSINAADTNQLDSRDNVDHRPTEGSDQAQVKPSVEDNSKEIANEDLNGNLDEVPMMRCVVCWKTSHVLLRSPSENSSGDWQRTAVSPPGEDRVVLRCDCCIHKGRLHDGQANGAEFFCQKCSLNFCHKCRDSHDETPLFKEHPVVPISGRAGGNEQMCPRHNNLSCCYFCLTCITPLCSLCVLFHDRKSSKSSSVSNEKSSSSKSPTRKSFLSSHKTSDPLPPALRVGELENYTLLRTVVSDDTFHRSSNSSNDHKIHRIVNYREALSVVREELKSSLNHLGPRLDILKERLRGFYAAPTTGENTPNLFPSEAGCSSSSSLSTISPFLESENTGHKQAPIKKRHLSQGEKKGMIKLFKGTLTLRSQEKERDSVKHLGRFKLSNSKKLFGSNNCHNNQLTTTTIKADLSPSNDPTSDGSEGNSWSSATGSSYLKLFKSFRKKFQLSHHPKSSSSDITHRRPNEPETLLAPPAQAAVPSTAIISAAPQKRGTWRKLSAGSAVCYETRRRADSLSEQEREFVNSSKLLVSKYLKLFHLATKSLESAQSKKLYDVYGNLASRIKIILQEEMPLLEPEIAKRILQRRERIRGNRSSDNLKRFVVNQEASNAALAILSAGCFDSLNGSAWDSVDQRLKIEVGEDSEEMWTSRRTILARPFQRWKYERSKIDLENAPVPCAAILVDDGRRAVIAEYDNNSIRNNRLQLLDASDGNFLESILEGQLQPLGMALNRDQNLVVSDCKGKRIKLISLETQTTIADMGKGLFGWPCGVAVNSRGQIVVSDVFNDCIVILSPDGKRLKTFCSSGSRQEQLRNPYHIAVDSRDRIFVSDNSNGAVKVFDQSGNLEFTSSEIIRRYSSTVDSSGERKAMSRKLKDPRGVAVDEMGNFLVADDYSRVSMFDSFGKFHRYLLTEEDSLKSPEGLSYCRTREDGLLLLTEWSPSNLYSVKLFSLYQNM